MSSWATTGSPDYETLLNKASDYETGTKEKTGWDCRVYMHISFKNRGGFVKGLKCRVGDTQALRLRLTGSIPKLLEPQGLSGLV